MVTASLAPDFHEQGDDPLQLLRCGPIGDLTELPQGLAHRLHVQVLFRDPLDLCLNVCELLLDLLAFLFPLPQSLLDLGTGVAGLDLVEQVGNPVLCGLGSAFPLQALLPQPGKGVAGLAYGQNKYAAAISKRSRCRKAPPCEAAGWAMADSSSPASRTPCRPP